MERSWANRNDRTAGDADALRDVQARLVTTPWVASWMGRARPGDRFDPDPSRRASAWATWLMENLTEISTGERRSYPAIRLDGRFYDPKADDITLRPHLEIATYVLNRPDDELPDRVAVAGNGLAFAWFRYEEVTAIRRALLGAPAGRIGDVVDALTSARLGLITTLEHLHRTIRPSWDHVERLLVTSAADLLPVVTGDFSAEDVAASFPALADHGVRVEFDRRLRERAGSWATRRLGVWHIRAGSGRSTTGFGAITPRLTANSVFTDPLFSPTREGLAALLVRTLVMRRLARFLGTSTDDVTISAPEGHLRAVVAQVGAKIPEASPQAAVAFIQDHPDPHHAWAALQSWSKDRYLLTVTEHAFTAAHRRALRTIRRAEDPARDDIDVVLPLAWNDGRVIRATYHHS